MPELPETLDDRVNTLAKLMHEQDDEQLNRIVVLEKLVQVLQGQLYALQAALAQLQGKEPVKGQKEGDEGADEAALGRKLNCILQGAAEVEQSVEGRQQ